MFVLIWYLGWVAFWTVANVIRMDAASVFGILVSAGLLIFDGIPYYRRVSQQRK